MRQRFSACIGQPRQPAPTYSHHRERWKPGRARFHLDSFLVLLFSCLHTVLSPCLDITYQCNPVCRPAKAALNGTHPLRHILSMTIWLDHSCYCFQANQAWYRGTMDTHVSMWIRKLRECKTARMSWILNHSASAIETFSLSL